MPCPEGVRRDFCWMPLFLARCFLPIEKPLQEYQWWLVAHSRHRHLLLSTVVAPFPAGASGRSSDGDLNPIEWWASGELAAGSAVFRWRWWNPQIGRSTYCFHICPCSSWRNTGTAACLLSLNHELNSSYVWPTIYLLDRLFSRVQMGSYKAKRMKEFSWIFHA